MGQLVEGVWKNVWYDTKSTGGRFQRTVAQFRNWLSKDASPGPDGQPGFLAERNRYHLYVSLACPWAHRVLILRKLKGLESLLPCSVVDPIMLDNGWTFEKSMGATGDLVHDFKYAYELYLRADQKYTGRVTVPILWDTKLSTIVSNESSELIRMLNTAFDDLGARQGNYYPNDLQKEIDQVNSWVYEKINNGVYKCGFATSQEAYDENIGPLFSALDRAESILTKQRYLVGNTLTEADIRLFTTLIRFDHVYVVHFKCDKKRIVDYPALSEYVRDIYQTSGIRDTVNLDHIRNHYFRSHKTINPSLILSIGPEVDFEAKHNRDSM